MWMCSVNMLCMHMWEMFPAVITLPYSSETDCLAKPGSMLIASQPKPNYLCLLQQNIEVYVCWSLDFHGDSMDLNSGLILGET